jgi:hypothetical protein
MGRRPAQSANVVPSSQLIAFAGRFGFDATYDPSSMRIVPRIVVVADAGERRTERGRVMRDAVEEVSVLPLRLSS